MDIVITITAVTFVLLIACIIAYSYYTNRVIKEQEREIVSLNTEIFRLKGNLEKAISDKDTQVIEIHDSTVDPKNVPDYKPF